MILRNLKVDEISMVKKGAGKGVRITLYKGAEMPMPTLDEVMAKLSDEEKAAVMAAIDAAKKPAEEMKAADPEKPMDPEMSKALAETHSLRARIAKMESENTRRELLSKADAYVGVPGMDREALADLLQVVGGTKIEDRVCKSLASVVEVVKQSGLFKAIGSDQRNDLGASDRLTAIAKSLREKDPSLNAASSLAKAYSQNPELYAELRKGG